MGSVPGLLTKHWFSVGAVLAVIATVAVLLCLPGDEESSLLVRNPFASDVPWAGAATGSDTGSGEHAVEWTGIVRGHGEWFGAQSIGINFATHGKTIPLTGGALTFGGCRFSAQPGPLRDNELHYFHTDASCSPGASGQEGSAASGQPFQLRLVYGGEPSEIAAWAHDGWTGSGFVVGEDKDQRVLIDRLIHKYEHPMSRFRMLASMWGGLEVALLSVLCLAALLLLGGIASAAKNHHNLFAALFFAAVALVTAALIPPFQAPDEPDHLLSYLRQTGQSEKAGETLAFAARGHFPMIRQVPAGTFNQYEVGNPSAQLWQMPWQDRVVNSRMEERSSLVPWVWKNAAVFTKEYSIGAQLLWLRVLSALLTLPVVWLLGRALQRGPGTAGLSLVLLIPPALPLFAVHVSNYSFLFLSTVLAYACALLTNAQSMRGVIMAGFGAGFFTAVSALLARSGFLNILVVVPILTMEFGIRMWNGRSRGKQAAAMIAACILPLLAGFSVFFLAPAATLSEISSTNAKVAAKFGLAPDFLLIRPQVLMVELALLWALALAGISRMFAFLRVRQDFGPKIRKVLSGCVYLLGAVLLFLCFKPHYRMPAVEHMPATATAEYVVKTFKTFFRDLTPFGNDFYMSISFWTGFGWLELHMPEFFSRSVKLIPVLMIGAGLWFARKRLAVWWRMFWFGGGLMVLLGSLAVGAYSVGYNLHGRYLLSFYLGWLVLTGLMFRSFWAAQGGGRRVILARIAVGLLLCAHVYSWSWTLERYF